MCEVGNAQNSMVSGHEAAAHRSAGTDGVEDSEVVDGMEEMVNPVPESAAAEETPPVVNDEVIEDAASQILDEISSTSTAMPHESTADTKMTMQFTEDAGYDNQIWTYNGDGNGELIQGNTNEINGVGEAEFFEGEQGDPNILVLVNNQEQFNDVRLQEDQLMVQRVAGGQYEAYEGDWYSTGDLAGSSNGQNEHFRTGESGEIQFDDQDHSIAGFSDNDYNDLVFTRVDDAGIDPASTEGGVEQIPDSRELFGEDVHIAIDSHTEGGTSTIDLNDYMSPGIADFLQGSVYEDIHGNSGPLVDVELGDLVNSLDYVEIRQVEGSEEYLIQPTVDGLAAFATQNGDITERPDFISAHIWNAHINSSDAGDRVNKNDLARLLNDHRDLVTVDHNTGGLIPVSATG